MKTVWGLRHLRWAYWVWRINTFWLSCGPGRWFPPDQSESDALEKIWKGEA